MALGCAHISTHKLTNRHSCLAHKTTDNESAGPIVEGTIRQTICLSAV